MHFLPMGGEGEESISVTPYLRFQFGLTMWEGGELRGNGTLTLVQFGHIACFTLFAKFLVR